MKILLGSDKVYVGESKIPKAERGVFAGRKIKKGEIIEICPTIEVAEYDTANSHGSTLVNYFFYFGKKKDRLAVVLGFGSIYNHSVKPNATFKITPKEKIISFVAIKNINKDEEITFDYYHGSNKNKKKDPLWFE